MILALFAEGLCLRQMVSHGIDCRLYVLVRVNTFRDRARLTRWFKADRAPVILGLLNL
jgi:hypothetical protein